MKHDDVRHRLSEYIDGSLPPGDRTAFEKHLRGCAECSDALRELRKTIEHLHSVPEVDAPPGMTGKIMARVREESERRRGFLRRLLNPLIVLRPLSISVLLFLAVAVYYLYADLRPAGQRAEAPAEITANRAAPENAGAMKKERLDRTAPAPKSVRQEPGYRSLAMKDEYERPAPPAPAAAPGLRGQKERSRSAAPAMMAEQASPPSVASRRPGNGIGRTAAKPQAPVAGGAAKSARQSEQDAGQIRAVTAYFMAHDLPDTMKVKGLILRTYRVHEGMPDLAWIYDTRAYASRPCKDRYLVDVELAGKKSKYLYCLSGSSIRLLGSFSFREGAWKENK